MIRESKNNKKKKSEKSETFNSYNIEIDFTEPTTNIIRTKKTNFSKNDFLLMNDENKKTDTDDTNNDSTDSSDTDGTDFRDKDKELKEKIKKGLSLKAQDVINMNDKEFNEIIEALKKMGIAPEKTAQLKIARSSSKENNNQIMR